MSPSQRKAILLFLISMVFSLILMIIIYGLFMKDFDMPFNAKNPDMAPSLIDPSTTSTPSKLDEMTDSPGDSSALNLPGDQDHPVENTTLPENSLESPSSNTPADTQPVPDSTSQTPNQATTTGDSDTLHYVYLDGFDSREAAERTLKLMQEQTLVAQPYIRQYKGQIVLQFGIFSDKVNAEDIAQQLRMQHVNVKVD